MVCSQDMMAILVMMVILVTVTMIAVELIVKDNDDNK